MAVAPDTYDQTSLAESERELTMRAHFDVCRFLKNLSREDIQELGEALGLAYPKLQKMSLLPQEMVAAWLNKEDNVLGSSGEPTWKSLEDALRKIGQTGFAEKVLRERLHHHGSTKSQIMVSKPEQESLEDTESQVDDIPPPNRHAHEPTPKEPLQQIDKYQVVQEEVNKLRRQFSKLQNNVWKTIADHQELLVFVLGMNILSEDDEEKVNKTPSEVCKVLTKYWSFLDYGNLEHIIENKCGEAEMQMMKEYRGKVKEFCERRVSEFPPGSLGSETEHTGMEEICVTLNLDDPYLKRIKDIKVVIANILGCSASKLVIENIRIGSVEVVFLVVASVGAKLFESQKLTAKQENELKKQHVLSLNYKSVVIFQPCFITNERSVVVTGKTGAGKSTIANKILESSDGENPFQDLDNVLDNDIQAVSAKKTLLKTRDGVYYSVQVVDTIGLFDTRVLERRNDEIMKEIKLFFSEKVLGVNLILFVVKLGRWTAEQQQLFDTLATLFIDSEISSISALVVTGCDGYTEEGKKMVCKEIEDQQPKIYRFMKKGVFTVSFPDISRVIPEIREIYKKQQKADQEKIRQLVCSCEEKKLANPMLEENKNFFESVGKWCNIM